MRRILLIGGYGGFGARIAGRLAAAGWEVLVAGRSRRRAEMFCAGRSGLVPLGLDRNGDLAAVLSETRPFAVIDAAGPFQGASYHVPRACIAAGCHYLDIADARGFVVGIATLDEAARVAGVAVICGASSVPGLSGAVVRELAFDMGEVRAVEMAISASNRASAGLSVTRAILSYLGQPIRLWRGRRWSVGRGWGSTQRQRFALSGAPPLGPRLVALADVPDLDLLPSRLPGCPAVAFRAGTEFRVHHDSMRLLSRLVGWGVLKSAARLAPPLVWLQGLTARWGSGRSGMVVRVFGLLSGRRVERRWTLVAANGDGPEIPGLAVPILLEALAREEVPVGARDAGTLLSLAAFGPAFAGLSVWHGSTEVAQPPSLYARVMGEAFVQLPPAVRAMHDVLRDRGSRGRARVSRARHPAARLIAAFFGFPREGEQDLHVWFSEIDGVETWTRDFGGRFRSRLSERDGRLVEQFGPFRFAFDLEGHRAGLSMHMRRWWLGPLPLPLALAPRSAAREWQEEGRFWFDVPIALPIVGLLVHYRGWLQDPRTLSPSAASDLH